MAENYFARIEKDAEESIGKNPVVKSETFFSNKRGSQNPETMRKFLGPEKKARFERTQEILAKSGLLDITKKTAVLIKSNQQAQADLQLLRQEINDFVQSVLANPENKGKSLAAARDTFAADPLNLERQQQPIPSPKPTQVSVIKSHQSSPYPKYHHHHHQQQSAAVEPFSVGFVSVPPSPPFDGYHLASPGAILPDSHGSRGGGQQQPHYHEAAITEMFASPPLLQLYHQPAPYGSG